MKIKKKISRKELLRKNDEFVSTTNNVIDWLKKNYNQLILYTIIFLLVLIVGFSIRSRISSKNENIQNFLTSAMNIYQAPVGTQTQEQMTPSEFKTSKEKYQKAKEEFNRILELYPKSDAAQDALFFKANCEYYLKEYDDTVNTSNEYIKAYPTGRFATQTLLTIAYSYKAKKEYQKEYEILQKIMDNYPNFLLKDVVYMELGGCYEKLKEIDKAKEVYQKLLIDFPNSHLIQKAQQMLDIININHND